MFQKLDRIRRFLKELQRSDNVRKKRWLIGATVFSMLVVLILWFVYINSVGVPSLIPESARQKQQLESEDESTWQIFKRGLGEVFEDAKDQFETSRKLIEEQLQKTNELIITTTSTNN